MSHSISFYKLRKDVTADDVIEVVRDNDDEAFQEFLEDEIMEKLKSKITQALNHFREEGWLHNYEDVGHRLLLWAIYDSRISEGGFGGDFGEGQMALNYDKYEENLK